MNLINAIKLICFVYTQTRATKKFNETQYQTQQNAVADYIYVHQIYTRGLKQAARGHFVWPMLL